MVDQEYLVLYNVVEWNRGIISVLDGMSGSDNENETRDFWEFLLKRSGTICLLSARVKNQSDQPNTKHTRIAFELTCRMILVSDPMPIFCFRCDEKMAAIIRPGLLVYT